jgi:anion-transporting  ArsA/GET3 family ATPase
MNKQVALDVLQLVDTKRILLCCGSGGVGKTTTAAALAFLAARRGRSVLVLTIDPAKRLAQAMGLDQLSHDPQAIDISTLSTAGNGGSLHGMMLDTKRTFDHLVEKYAPNDEVRQAIFNNRHYQHVSSSLAGSREFMAMERVYEIVIEDRYDLVVVDTPPSQHALDFIDAPRRMFDLFEGRFVALLLKPYQVVGKRSFEFLRRGSERPLKFMAKLTGYQFLAELAEFFLAFSDMFEGFKERSERVRELLLKDDSSFLLICAPEPGSLKQAEHFFHRLQGDSLPVGGMIVNRVHHARGPDSLGEAAQNEIRQFAAALDPAAAPGQAGSETDLAERLLLCYREQHALAQADHYAISQTRVAEQRIAIHNVPHFEHDLHSLEDIQAFADKLADP